MEKTPAKSSRNECIGAVSQDSFNINEPLIDKEICISLAKGFEGAVERQGDLLNCNIIPILIGCSEEVIKHTTQETKVKSLIGKESYILHKESAIQHAINQGVSYSRELTLLKGQVFKCSIDNDGQYAIKNYEKSNLASYELYKSLFKSFAEHHSGIYTYSNQERALFSECLDKQLPNINKFALSNLEYPISFPDVHQYIETSNKIISCLEEVLNYIGITILN